MSFAGVILAGGRGTRMGPLGERYPKALLPVGDRPVIGHHLAFLESLGIERLVIVLGHRGEDIRRALGMRSAGGRPIAYAEQPSPLGSAHAVACARHEVDGPFVLLLGDYFFRAPGAGPLLLEHLERGDSAMLAKREPDLALVRAACTLELDDGGRVRRIVEKPRQPTTDLKGCGVYALQPEVHEAIAATPPTGTRGEHELSVALQLFVDAGHRLFAEEVIEWDRNLTCPGDVLRCNLEWLDRHGVSRWIAEGASVPSGSPVERAVVGPGAEVSPGVRVRNAVVFPEARVTRDSRRGLITPYGRFSCEAEAAPGGGAAATPMPRARTTVRHPDLVSIARTGPYIEPTRHPEEEDTMTTPRPDDIFRIGNIRDVASLKLIGRVLEGQITMLESQRVQLEELHSNIEEQIANIDKRG